MFTKEELLVIEDALKIADEKYIKLLDESKNNKNKMVAFNRKQKKLWLVQNKLNKILKEEIPTLDVLLAFTRANPLRETMQNLRYEKAMIQRVETRLSEVIE